MIEKIIGLYILDVLGCSHTIHDIIDITSIPTSPAGSDCALRNLLIEAASINLSLVSSAVNVIGFLSRDDLGQCRF